MKRSCNADLTSCHISSLKFTVNCGELKAHAILNLAILWICDFAVSSADSLGFAILVNPL